MPKLLSNDLRKRLIKAIESGLSARAAGRKLEIAEESTATGIVKDWRDRTAMNATDRSEAELMLICGRNAALRFMT